MKNRPTSINIPAEVLTAVDEVAANSGMSRSAWIVAAIRSMLASDAPLNVEDNTAEALNLAARVADIEARLSKIERARPRPSGDTPRDKPAPVRAPANNATTATSSAGGRYDEAAILDTIERMRLEQTANGFKPNNKAIADALNAAGLPQSNGNPWNNDRINTVIGRKLSHLKTK